MTKHYKNSKDPAMDTLQAIYPDLREVVTIISKCTRAFVHACFDTAEKWDPGTGGKPLPGAALPLLLAQQNKEGVSEQEWDIYREIWHHFGRGARLVESEEVVNISGVRNRLGKYSYSRPGVFSTLERLVSDALPQTLLSDWYRSNLCERYDILDSRDFIVFAQEWLSKFNQLNSATYSRNELVNLVSLDETFHIKEWAEGLVETLDYLALIQYTDKNRYGYKLRFKANSSFILASLFGRSTGIQGLDYLLFGGLWVPGSAPGRTLNPENLTAVISGPPGMGKSTLALSMGIQVAARGGFCLYFRFEPDEVTILRQIVQYYRSLLPQFRIVSHTGKVLHPSNASSPQAQRPSQGLMLISDIATGPIEEIKNTTISIANDPQAKDFSERIVIFDSISAAQDYEEDSTLWRKFLFEISSILRAMGYIVLFIVEREKGTTVSFEDYVADIDIRLAHRESHYSFRTLEIAKSRWQASHRGSHVYSISADVGIRVAPSSNAVLSARRLREARIRYEENRLISPGINNFAIYLGGTNTNQECSETTGHKQKQGGIQGEGSNRSHIKTMVSWWKQSSVTALMGPRGTYKKAFARIFARTLDGDTFATPCALSLHFADEFQSIRRQFRRDKQQTNPFGVRYDIPLQTAVHDKLSPTLSYILFRSSFLAPGFVLQTVRDIIREKRKSQTPIRRAVISDVGNIAPNFPALKDDPIFIPALCDLLTSEGITTVIVYSSPEQGTYDPTLDQIRSVAENLVRFDHISYAGREYTSIKVQRSADNSHDRGLYEIRQPENSRSKEELEIAPTFDLVLDINTGMPKIAKVKITLNAGTELQHQWHSTVKSLYHGLGAYDIQIIDHRLAFARQGLPQHIMAAERALWIAQVDAHELPLNPNITDRSRSGFCNLSALSPRFNQRVNELSHAADIQAKRKFPNDKTRPPILSVPFYLNPSFLVVRNEFRDFTLNRDNWRNIGAGEGEYSWQDLISASVEFKATDPAWDDYAIFDCASGSSEVLNCLFLEVLASFNNGDLRDKDFIDNFGGDSPFIANGENLLVKAILVLRQLLKGTYQGYHPAAPNQRPRKTDGANITPAGLGTQISQPYTTQNAIMWRHWYSSSRQMAADMAEGDCSTNPGLSLLKLPGGVWTNGDWHLTMLEGSIGTRLGADIIFDRFVNKPTAMAMIAQGVGLPPFKDFYTNMGELPVSGVAPNWFAPYVAGERVIYRSSLKGYRRLASILSSYVASMISLDLKNEDDFKQIENRFSSMKEMINKW